MDVGRRMSSVSPVHFETGCNATWHADLDVCSSYGPHPFTAPSWAAASSSCRHAGRTFSSFGDFGSTTDRAERRMAASAKSLRTQRGVTHRWARRGPPILFLSKLQPGAVELFLGGVTRHKQAGWRARSCGTIPSVHKTRGCSDCSCQNNSDG